MRETQNSIILDYMKKFGGITQKEAIEAAACTRLSARIYDLRKSGHKITASTESCRNKFGVKVSYLRYRLED